jgi:hypothetical protein
LGNLMSLPGEQSKAIAIEHAHELARNVITNIKGGKVRSVRISIYIIRIPVMDGLKYRSRNYGIWE